MKTFYICCILILFSLYLMFINVLKVNMTDINYGISYCQHKGGVGVMEFINKKCKNNEDILSFKYEAKDILEIDKISSKYTFLDIKLLPTNLIIYLTENRLKQELKQKEYKNVK